MKNEIQKGALYLVSTPIGNLGDITVRGSAVLADVDFIAAEDTRVTMKLLSHLGIKKPLVSYFEHNIRERGKEICARLKAGESAALVTDAGTPAISDPGEDIVRLCAEEDIPVYSVPGACAAISALTLSGLFTGRFAFEGFLSYRKSESRKRLLEIKDDRRTLIFYEAPHKLVNTLELLYEYLGDRRISIVKEITKINESVIRTTLSEAVTLYDDEQRKPRGEFVLVVEGAAEKNEMPEKMNTIEHFEHYLSEGMSEKDAIKEVARARGEAKNTVYMQVKKYLKEKTEIQG